jgi:hypothetical protein
MTAEKVVEVIERYRELFVARGIATVDYPHDEVLADETLGLEHCHRMLDKMLQFIREGRMEKTFRWLGFIQGVLWSQGIYTLTDLQNHNRP